MRGNLNLRDEAELFLDEVRSMLIDALPLVSEGDIETEAWLNADTNTVVGEFDARLSTVPVSSKAKLKAKTTASYSASSSSTN